MQALHPRDDDGETRFFLWNLTTKIKIIVVCFHNNGYPLLTNLCRVGAAHHFVVQEIICAMSCTVEGPLSKNTVIIAGPNGAGKTTFVSEYLPVSGAEYISADAIAATLVSTPGEFDKIRVRAGRLFLERIQRLIQAEANLVIEVTLAGRGFRRIIHQLNNTGYTVTIVFIFLKSPEMCIARVRNRVMAGGHHVPAEDIVRRFYRSKHNFWGVYQEPRR